MNRNDIDIADDYCKIKYHQFGQTITINTEIFKYIDTIMRVTGGNTGFSVDIPLRFLKKTN